MEYSNSLLTRRLPVRRKNRSGLATVAGWVVLLVLGLFAPIPAFAASESTDRLEAWQNVAVRWGSGAQSGNSAYAEGAVIPMRWVGTLRGGSTATIWIKYDFLLGSQARFFDALTSYDATETGVNLASQITLSGSPSSWAIQPDPAVPAEARPVGNLTTYNVQQLTFGQYTTVNGVRSVPLTIKVAGTSGNKTVVIGYGVRLASAEVWGSKRAPFNPPAPRAKPTPASAPAPIARYPSIPAP